MTSLIRVARATAAMRGPLFPFGIIPSNRAIKDNVRPVVKTAS